MRPIEHERPFESRLRRWGGRGWFGRFGPIAAPGMPPARMFAAGDLRLIILALLSERPRHGYEIIKAIEEHSSGIYTPSPGMVYPALKYLEETWHAASEPQGAKKLYQITEAGAQYLSKHRADVDGALDQLARYGRQLAHLQQRFAEETEFEDFDPGLRGRAKSEWRQTKMEFRELRDELRAALHERFDASLEERKRIIAILRRAVDEIQGTRTHG
ncbi:MAG: PadR family transcriptional regulator [Bryobacteraceae bacterium]